MEWNFKCKSDQSSLKYTFYESAYLVPEEHWQGVVQEDNIYLNLDYLRILEKSMDRAMDFRYVIFYCEQLRPVAVAYCQVVEFHPAQMMEKPPNGFSGIAASMVEKLDLKVLVCGNMFACGENGFHHVPELSQEKAYKNLAVALYKLRRSENFSDSPISLVLLKEFWPKSVPYTKVISEEGYRDFNIDVNMVLQISKKWKGYVDYLDSMVSKFRTKAKSVMKKSAALEVRDLSLAEIQELQERMFQLYNSVIEKADYNFATLQPGIFQAFKTQLNDQFICRGYFLEGKLVGFCTAFHWADCLDANYVGLDYKLNEKHSIYHRMLYDFVDSAIQLKARELRLGRTAEQIKSCLGAEPIHMKLFIKHRNSLSNRLVKHFVSSISPSEFELRKPFKAEFKNA